MRLLRLTFSALILAHLLASVVWAQSQDSTEKTGIGFELGTRNFSPNDSRVQGASSTFRINFRGKSGLDLFYERETMGFTFKNSGGTPSSLPGRVYADGVGFSAGLADAVRFELVVGRATTSVQSTDTPLNSSDPLMNLGGYWDYAVSDAYLAVGLIYRVLTLSGNLAGNVLDTGSTNTDSFEDMGGILLHVGVGMAF